MTSDFAEESSEGGSNTSSVQKLAESLSAIVETLNSASKGKGKGRGKKGSMGPRFLPPHAECGGQSPAVAAAKVGRESH